LGFGEGRFVAVGDTSNGGASRTIGSTDTPDTAAPLLIQQVPSDGATDVDDTSNISLTFSENVVPGPGQQLVIKKVSDNSTVASIEVSSSQVTISGAVVTINPTLAPIELPAATALYVLIDRGAFTDIAGNGFAGISSSSSYRFTTAVDVTPPAPPTTPDLFETADTGFSNSDNIITSTVNPNFRFRGTERGGIITVTASRTGVSDRTCTRPGDTQNDGCIMAALTQGTWTVVTSHTDVNGNTSASSAALTVVVDGTAPSLTSVSPARDAASVAVDANIQLTYNEDVYAATGNVIVKSGGSTCPTTDQTISVSSAAVTAAGGTVTVNPPNNFAHSSVQCLSFAAGVIKDIAGNNAPLHDPTASGGVRFTTSAPDVTSPSATISSPASPASSRTLVYAVVFDETVNGVAASDFQNLGTATCTFSVNQSSGTTISLTATCTSDGTIIVRLGANSVSDAASNTGPAGAVTASTVTIDSPVNTTSTSSTTTVASAGLPLTTTPVVTPTTVATGQGQIAVVSSTTSTTSPPRTGAVSVSTSSTPVASSSTVPATSSTVPQLSSIDLPRTEVGGSGLLLGGKEVEAVIVRENNRLVITAGPLVVRIWAVAADGSRLSLDDDGRLRVNEGDSVTVNASGFTSDSKAEVRLYSTPILLGRTNIDGEGELVGSYEIPKGVENGNHNVVLVGERNGEDVVMSLSIVLGNESNSRALTVVVVFVLLLAVTGALLIPAIVRRRREEVEA
jgi:methionine-rich copper-binding protein CopC